jgi:hypothetical protein
MSDSKQETGKQDRIRINSSEDYEVRDWSAKFGCSKELLLQAIDKVGPMAADVEKEVALLKARHRK